MAKTVRIDDVVYSELQRRAKPFEDTPNSVLRRLLGLDVQISKEIDMLNVLPTAYLVPHSTKEFETAQKLADWLCAGLGDEYGKGTYCVASIHYWRNVAAGSICLFHKGKQVVGEARLADALKPYTGPDLSPDTKKRYEGYVRFAPETIKCYKPYIPFVQIQTVLGKSLTWRGIQGLTWDEYKKIQGLV